jgi:ATP-dependent DNA helicase PIF1
MYGKHCKFQVIRYKVWNNDISDALGAPIATEDPDCKIWIAVWKRFLEDSNASSNRVPNWQSVLDEARTAIEYAQTEDIDLNQPLGEQFLDDSSDEIDEEQRLDWMVNMVPNDQRPSTPPPADISRQEAIEYWARDRLYMEDDDERAHTLTEIDNWIFNERRKCTDPEPPRPVVNENQLNTKQRRAFKLVMRFVERVEREQLLFRLEGTAGTGKSHVLNALCHRLPENSFKVVAATGKAANNVLGRTIHELLSIHPNNPECSNLIGNPLIALQNRLKGVNILFVDEFSLLGCRMLARIDSRLRQAFPERSSQPFGGVHMVLCGDTKQIPAIGDVALWNVSAMNNQNLHQQVVSGLALFASFKLVLTLTVVMRQCEPREALFRDTLMRIRSAQATADDYELLRSRIAYLDPSMTAEFMALDPLYLTATNQKAKDFNTGKIQSLLTRDKIRQCTIQAKHSSPAAANKSDEDFQNLEANIVMCVGARVMLTSNLWVQRGLMNGAMGTVRRIVFAPNEAPPLNQPRAIIVEMDSQYVGPSLPGFPPRHVAFYAQTNYMIDHRNVRLERTQFPLRCAFAMTIHKCQG